MSEKTARVKLHYVGGMEHIIHVPLPIKEAAELVKWVGTKDAQRPSKGLWVDNVFYATHLATRASIVRG